MISLVFVCPNVPITSVLTYFTLTSWKDFDVSFSLIGSKEWLVTSYDIILFFISFISYLADTCRKINPTNVTVSYEGPGFGGRYFLGATASVSCAEGYELHGVSSVSCAIFHWTYPISQFRCIPSEQSEFGSLSVLLWISLCNYICMIKLNIGLKSTFTDFTFLCSMPSSPIPYTMTCA